MPAVVASIQPPALPVGPPADTVLHVFGTGFDATSAIRFGTVLERTDYVDATEVTTIISQGIFPSADADVPVSVLNASDGIESNAVAFAFVAIPPMPVDGSLVANLANLKLYVGARSNQDDVILSQRLDVATEYVFEHTYPDHYGHPDVAEAILMMASRLYKRRQSPDGVSGWAGVSTDVRIVAGDPDFNDLLSRHRDWKRTAGIA